MKEIETERKYVILIPDREVLLRQSNFTESEITQIYLNDPHLTHRIRKRKYADRTEYTENTKYRISKYSCIEHEEIISEERFSELASNIEIGSRPLKKIRTTFDHCGKTIELDRYDEWEKTCIMEVELGSEEESVSFPDFIKILKEVTGERQYSNHSMAKAFPNELI